MADYTDNTTTQSSGYSGFGKAALGAGLAGAGAYGLSKAIPQYSSTLKWIENDQEMMRYNFDKTKTFLAEFLNKHPELAKYLVSIKENPGTTALATVATVLAGYGLYKGLKAWREFLRQKREENPELASEIPANA